MYVSFLEASFIFLDIRIRYTNSLVVCNKFFIIYKLWNILFIRSMHTKNQANYNMSKYMPLERHRRAPHQFHETTHANQKKEHTNPGHRERKNFIFSLFRRRIPMAIIVMHLTADGWWRRGRALAKGRAWARGVRQSALPRLQFMYYTPALRIAAIPRYECKLTRPPRAELVCM